MKKEFIRIISFILALITLTLCLGACAQGGGGADDTTSADVNLTEAATAPTETDPPTDEWGRPYIASPIAEGTRLEDGTVITVLLRDDETWNREFYAESDNGDILNDAIYKRNQKLEEDLNFKFEFIESSSKDETQLTVIAELQSGGSSNLDLISNYAAYSTVAALRDCYENLYDVDTMNISNPWWNQTYVEAATIKDQLYFIVGDLNLTGVDRAIVIYYNTTLAGDYKIGNLYDVVLDGQWTIDLLIQYSKDAWVDTNQSGALHKTSFGGECIVFCGTPDMPFKYYSAFSLLNETRKRQLVDILSKNDLLPVYYPEDAELYLRAGRLPDGEIFAAAFNLSQDALDELPLVIKTSVARVDRLNERGELVPCDFEVRDSVTYIKTPIAAMEPIVLIIG